MSKKNIQDIYPLSPTQEGMLFHSLYAPQSGVYCEQFTCTLVGNLDFAAFQYAWQQATDRHAILRTAFAWEGLKKPMQVVGERVKISIEQQDLSVLLPHEQESREETYLQAIRDMGFNLSKAPLMKLALFRLAENRHRFIWSFHHLLLDGWSYPLLLQEVLAFYTAYTAQKELDLPQPRPYRDYILWLQKQNIERAESFWRKNLRGFTAPIQLPIEKTVSAEQDRHAEQDIYLSAEQTIALQAFARKHQLTLNSLLQGAWALLLSRYSGENDIVFGVTTSGRPADFPGVEAMIGMFICTLPMRVQVNGGSQLIPWLKEVQTCQIEMRQFEYTSLAQIQNWSNVQRGFSLFNNILVFENYPMSESAEENSLGLEDIRGFEKTNYPLAVVAIPGPSLMLKFSYDANRYEDDAITRLAGNLRQLLDEMLTTPHRHLSELCILTEGEYQTLLTWGRPVVEQFDIEQLHQAFELQVARTPFAEALVFEGQRWTYAELNRKASQLAHFLRQRGVGPEVVVGMYVERSADAVIGLLGILKAGGVYLPLDPAYPTERVAFLLQDTHAPLVLTQEKLTVGWNYAAEFICIDSVWQEIAHFPDTNPISINDGTNLAYLIYTSGSTGQPKGVGIAHREAAQHLLAAAQRFGITSSDRVLQFAALTFDVSIEQIFNTLLGGACLVLRGPEMWSIEEFSRQLYEQKITIFNVPPAYWHQLTQAWSADPNLLLNSSVRLIIVGGDVLLPESIRLWRQATHAGARLLNAYGPTETVITATTFEIVADQPEPEHWTKIPIGRPLGARSAYIWDECGMPVPVGVVGELCLGGLLARGYLNQPTLTAEKFTPDPFSPNPGARVYRTGDRARYLPDGQIEFLGRSDFQVKIRGFRIELGEIESVISEHNLIKDVVVIGEKVPGALADKRLIAYFVPQTGKTISTIDLRDFVKQRLPDYMVPAVFMPIDLLPLTTSGKVDRNALPAPELALEKNDTFVAPHNRVEETLCRIWAEVLGLDRVGIYDNFFELGGDSILSIQIISRASQAGLKLSPRIIFQYQTVAALAPLAVVGESVLPRNNQLLKGSVPLLPIQHWFFEQALVAQHYFNQSFLIDFTMPVQITALERALGAILLHHDALRMRYHRAPVDGWTQVYTDPESNLPFQQIALPTASDPGFAVAIAEAQASLDLEKGPLFRAVLFNFGETCPARLLLVVHHLVVDGVSWRILLDDLKTAYIAACQNMDIRLPDKTHSYRDWGKKLAAYAQSETLLSELDFWTPPTDVMTLPVDYVAQSRTEASAEVITVCLETEATQSLLHDVPAVWHTQISEVLLAALMGAFSKWMGASSLWFDTEGHGREALFDDLDITQTVGWFTSLYPLHLQTMGASGPDELLKTVKEQVRKIPKRGIGFGLLRYLNQQPEIQNCLKSLPPREICFNYLGQFDIAPEKTGPFHLSFDDTGASSSLQNRLLYRLEINSFITQGQLQVIWRYSAQEYARTTIERLATSYIHFLHELIASSQQPKTGVFTPSDFPEAGLMQDDLDDLLAELE